MWQLKSPWDSAVLERADLCDLNKNLSLIDLIFPAPPEGAKTNQPNNKNPCEYHHLLNNPRA